MKDGRLASVGRGKLLTRPRCTETLCVASLQIAAAVNMTAAFAFQTIVKMSGDYDTGNHNYYMYKQPADPWQIILYDADQGLGCVLWSAPADAGNTRGNLYGAGYPGASDFNHFFKGTGGAMSTTFEAEYLAFVRSVLRMPAMLECRSVRQCNLACPESFARMNAPCALANV